MILNLNCGIFQNFIFINHIFKKIKKIIKNIIIKQILLLENKNYKI
jgi:hypothetical protein